MILQHTKQPAKYSLAVLLIGAIISLSAINICKGAGSKTLTPNTILLGDTIFTRVDKPPVFPGGTDAFIKYLAKSVRYPDAMAERGIENKVIARFVVEIDGSISKVTILDGPGYGSSEEAIRVLKKSPKWQPGINNGKPVRVQLTVPIDFRSKGDNQNKNTGFDVIKG